MDHRQSEPMSGTDNSEPQNRSCREVREKQEGFLVKSGQIWQQEAVVICWQCGFLSNVSEVINPVLVGSE